MVVRSHVVFPMRAFRSIAHAFFTTCIVIVFTKELLGATGHWRDRRDGWTRVSAAPPDSARSIPVHPLRLGEFLEGIEDFETGAAEVLVVAGHNREAVPPRSRRDVAVLDGHSVASLS